MNVESLYQIALSMIPNLEPVEAKVLLQTAESAVQLFDEDFLNEIPNLNPGLKENLTNGIFLRQAEEEFENAQKNDLEICCFNDPDFPDRLRECPDSPLVLFSKGKSRLNNRKVVSIVGTRQATPYGRDITHALVRDLAKADPDLLIVSGLAYGIDIMAHQAALEHGLQTVCVLAHGLQSVYPPMHSKYAVEMIRKGGSNISEFRWGTPAMKHHFLKRNRIIAGLCDVCIIVESGSIGGSMKTARLARDYDREVFCFPGRITDKNSKGCNMLISDSIADLIQDSDDLIKKMGWDTAKREVQQKMFVELSGKQQTLFDLMKPSEAVSIELLAQTCGWNIQETLAVLMELELEGLIERRPGGNYRIFMN
jgi:DNA processing protein